MQSLRYLSINVLIDNFYENWPILKNILDIEFDVRVKNQIAYGYAWIVMIKSQEFVNHLTHYDVNRTQSPKSVFSSPPRKTIGWWSYIKTVKYVSPDHPNPYLEYLKNNRTSQPMIG